VGARLVEGSYLISSFVYVTVDSVAVLHLTYATWAPRRLRMQCSLSRSRRTPEGQGPSSIIVNDPHRGLSWLLLAPVVTFTISVVFPHRWSCLSISLILRKAESACKSLQSLQERKGEMGLKMKDPYYDTPTLSCRDYVALQGGFSINPVPVTHALGCRMEPLSTGANLPISLGSRSSLGPKSQLTQCGLPAIPMPSC
jgi:hypothetical protein